MTDCSIVITTTNKSDIAYTLSKRLVELGLVRCVHVDKTTSFYEWQGVIEEEEEYRLFIYAPHPNIDAIEQQIATLHNYDLPKIITVDIRGGSDKYLAWLKAPFTCHNKSDFPVIP